jgi:predicted deacylase
MRADSPEIIGQRDDQLVSYTFAGLEPGPHVLILGAVHGNEKCGSDAILNRVLPRLQSKEMDIIRGRVTFVPICNPRAYAADKRYIEANLNRHMGPKVHPQHYEDHLMNALVPYLQNCDVLVDIHSYTAGGAPFALRGMNFHRDQEEALVAAMGIQDVLYGFADAYKNCGLKYDPRAATGTMDYARERGAYGVTIECGQHKDPVAVDVAEAAIYGALTHLGLIEVRTIPESCAVVRQPLPLDQLRHIHLDRVMYKDRDGQMIGDLQHMAPVRAGDVIARYDDGEDVVATQGGVMIMPCPHTPVGTEWWYIGVDE